MMKRVLSLLVRGLFPLGLGLLLWSAVFPGAGDDQNGQRVQIDAKEQELKRVRAQLEEKRLQAEELTQKEKQLLTRIKGIEERLHLAKCLVGGLGDKADALNASIEEILERIDQKEEDLATGRHILSERIKRIYKYGSGHFLEIILSSNSLIDFSRRIRFLQLMALQETRLLRKVRRAREELELRRSELSKQLHQVETTMAEKRREEQLMDEEANERRRMLNRVRTEKSAHQRAIAELEESSQQLQKIIDRLEAMREKTAGKGELFKARRGHLIWPVRGKVISSFGKHVHPVFKTVTYHKGIDIQVPLGADVRSVFAGTAIYIGWLRGYGQFLILHHAGDYYTLYAHLSEVSVHEGSQVEEGEIIAKAGETGSLNGPKLYFEIRKGRQQLNPLDWLRKS